MPLGGNFGNFNSPIFDPEWIQRLQEQFGGGINPNIPPVGTLPGGPQDSGDTFQMDDPIPEFQQVSSGFRLKEPPASIPVPQDPQSPPQNEVPEPPSAPEPAPAPTPDPYPPGPNPGGPGRGGPPTRGGGGQPAPQFPVDQHKAQPYVPPSKLVPQVSYQSGGRSLFDQAQPALAFSRGGMVDPIPNYKGGSR